MSSVKPPCRRQAEREAAAAAAVPADEPWRERLQRLALRAFMKARAAVPFTSGCASADQQSICAMNARLCEQPLFMVTSPKFDCRRGPMDAALSSSIEADV